MYFQGTDDSGCPDYVCYVRSRNRRADHSIVPLHLGLCQNGYGPIWCGASISWNCFPLQTPKRAPRSPKMLQDSPKTAPSRFQDASFQQRFALPFSLLPSWAALAKRPKSAHEGREEERSGTTNGVGPEWTLLGGVLYPLPPLPAGSWGSCKASVGALISTPKR